MTPVMFASRIPVPIKNVDDTDGFRHRSTSAKTRLERLREEFQRKLLVEKHEKLLDFFEQKQLRRQRHRRTLAHRLRFGSGEIGYGRRENPGAATNFFHQKESLLIGFGDNADTLPKIQNQHKGNSIRKPPLPAYQKKAIGFDKSHPLAPINPAKLNNNGLSNKIDAQSDRSQSLESSSDSLGTTYTLKKSKAENIERDFAPRPPGIGEKPKILRPFVRNKSYRPQSDNREITLDDEQHAMELLKLEKLRRANEAIAKERNYSKPGMSLHREAESERDEVRRAWKSDFQKPIHNQWYDQALLENEEIGKQENFEKKYLKAKQGVLQKVNEKISSKENISFQRGDSIKESNDQNKLQKIPSSQNMAEELDYYDPYEAKKQKHQNNIKDAATFDENDHDGDDDDEDQKLRLKEKELRVLIQRQEEQLKKLRQENLREKESQRQLENRRKEEKYSEKNQMLLKTEVSNQENFSDESVYKIEKQPTSKSNAREYSAPIRRMSQASVPPKPKWHPEVDSANEETAFYLQKAISDGNLGADSIKMVVCGICGRSFASERLAKHEKICSKGAKKTRKVFDHVAMRYRGTDFENHFIRQDSMSEEMENHKKSLWRAKHQNFAETNQYAKKVSNLESQSANLSDPPNPSVANNPDYIQCPHCLRRFNEKAADRHIEWCKESKSRKPLKH